MLDPDSSGEYSDRNLVWCPAGELKSLLGGLTGELLLLPLAEAALPLTEGQVVGLAYLSAGEAPFVAVLFAP